MQVSNNRSRRTGVGGQESPTSRVAATCQQQGERVKRWEERMTVTSTAAAGITQKNMAMLQQVRGAGSGGVAAPKEAEVPRSQEDAVKDVGERCDLVRQPWGRERRREEREEKEGEDWQVEEVAVGVEAAALEEVRPAGSWIAATSGIALLASASTLGLMRRKKFLLLAQALTL
eukprot:65398-Hanusia_phi.AAC.1